jgi:hypothetical protein
VFEKKFATTDSVQNMTLLTTVFTADLKGIFCNLKHILLDIILPQQYIRAPTQQILCMVCVQNIKDEDCCIIFNIAGLL